MAAAVALAALNAMDRDAFVAVLGPTFENSPWVAASAWSLRPFGSVEALHAAMLDVVRQAPEETRLAFLCAHPELAGREAQAGTMTTESTGEQGSAGLNALTGAERAEMQQLNRTYRERHGFPFIIAVRDNTKQQIFAAMRSRTSQTNEVERHAAIDQIGFITRKRIDAIVTGRLSRAPYPLPATPKEEIMAKNELLQPARRQFALSGLALGAAALLPAAAAAQTPAPAQGTGPVVQAGVSPRLTVHAIDIYHGSAAAGMRIDFSKREGESYKLVRTIITNATGRSDDPLLVGESYQPGEYELLLYAGEYFARKEAKLPTPPFLTKVPVRIRIANINERIHLPIQFGPWSYTYSRGS